MTERSPRGQFFIRSLQPRVRPSVARDRAEATTPKHGEGIARPGAGAPMTGRDLTRLHLFGEVVPIPGDG
jgi:hypothetical protein